MTGGDQQENGAPSSSPQGLATGLGSGSGAMAGSGPGSGQPVPPAGPSVRQDPATRDYNEYGAPRARWLTVTDAMEYLDSVKLEFRDQPEIYDEFLAIMGRFKTKQMLPPDVIVEVARLFRGRNALVLRFNRFLPEGYKIAPSDIERMEEDYVAKEQAAARANREGAGGPLMADIRNRGGAREYVTRDNSVDGVLGQAVGVDGDISVRSTPSLEESEDGDRDDPGGNEFEFDHAIQYVTTIKRRFSDDIGTYKAFLEILHTYQREQQGINHVLEQVTDLFADEPDLLREFTYFLPDGVQAQAKERLDKAAVEAEVRLGRVHNGQRLERLPAQRAQGGYQRGQGRDRQTILSRELLRGYRMQVQHPQTPWIRSAHRGDADPDREWRNQSEYGRSRYAMHRGFQGGNGSRSQYSNGEMGSDRLAPRQPYAGNISQPSQRMSRHARKGRQVWCHAEDYELGPDGVFKGPKKRARASDDIGGTGEGRGWSSAGPPGGTIKPSDDHQLFDQARQVLSSGGDANDWTEFLKCLDLFSNQILGRDELLEMVQDLFEAHNEFDLMDDFKGLVYRRGELEPPPRDAMPTLGLSEINFQSAKMCTPSYRELPKDYQSTSCSGRSADEDMVLNDMWVSVPVGSEDSNNFKHMRRNPHEEALFKMEDERFELDMLIDGVAATIARLEPVEEDIEALRATAESALGQTLGALGETGGAGVPPMGWAERSSDALPQFQYRLDRRTLGALHLSTVSRLYGEHGGEVLELLRKNPAVAIPVVLKRLREKELEWRAAREEAKSGWKELTQKHFHRSLDHRTHHFRREDKRHTSNRVLLQEIKDRKVEEDPQQAAVVKAAREKVHNAQEDVLLLGRVSPTSTTADADSMSGQGSGGEADGALDVAQSDAGARDSPEALPVSITDAAVSEGRPRSKEGIRLMRQQAEEDPPWYMFAHLTLAYPKEDTTSIHKDIMELLSHTLARRPPSEDDVRQASTVVADLLPTFFALDQPKPTANGAGSNPIGGEGGEGADGIRRTAQEVRIMPVLSSDDDSDRETSQSSGEDRLGDRRADSSSDAGGVAVQIPSAKGAGSAKDEGCFSVEGASTPLPQHQEVFFTTTDFYLVLRMHHLLAERLFEAKKLCREAGLSRQTVVATPQEVLRASAGVAAMDGIAVTGPHSDGGDKEEIDYKTFLAHLYDLLEEKITMERYEEGVRQLVGNQGYVLCNLDKLVVALLQNLYRASADSVFHKLTQLYYYERTTQGEAVSPALYRSHAQQLLRRSEKEIVRVQYHPGAGGAAGSWLVEPTLKVEYIGRLGTEEEGQQDGSRESDKPEGARTADASVESDATPVAMET